MIVELEAVIPMKIISKPADAVLKGCDSWTVTSEKVDGFFTTISMKGLNYHVK